MSPWPCVAAILGSLGAVACSRSANGANSGEESRARVVGTAVFDDAPTDAEGTHLDPAVPTTQHGAVWLVVTGPADIADDCADAATGTYRAYFSGDALFDGGEIRAPLYPAATPATYTPGGCPARRLEVHGMSNVNLLAEIPATPSSCRDFCAAHARRRAYDQCMGTSSDQPACRGEREPEIAVACEATCADAASIAGYGDVNQSTLPAADADQLQDGELGDVEATIILDHLVDSANQTIPMQ